MVYYEESGKNAIVTGAERGIGKGIALRLAQAGYNIFFTYYFKDSYAEELKRSIEKLGRRCVALKADFRDSSVVETVVKAAAKSLGGIDLLVNNAAIMPPRAYQYEYTAEHIDEVCAVNYRGYMLLMRDALRYWIKNGKKGNIVNISSESAIRSHQKFSLYGGIKAAILRSTGNVALDAAPYGIRVNCILPGAIDTFTEQVIQDEKIPQSEVIHRRKFGGEIPLRRLGKPEEIGSAVLWLASEEAAYITGATLVVDGGLVLPGMTDMTVEKDESVYGWCTQKRLSDEQMENW